MKIDGFVKSPSVPLGAFYKAIVPPTFYEIIKIEGFVKRQKSTKFVIPVKARIELFQDVLDPGFRRGDGVFDFLRDHIDSKKIKAASWP